MPKSTAIVPASAASVPSLPKGNDAEVADKLKSLIRDADEGLMRIARLGAFIDHIKANLPHGHFNAWLAAWCDVSSVTIHRWRKITYGLLNDAGITGQKIRSLDRPLYEVLELPFDQLSDKEAAIVESIRDAAQNTTHRRLQNRPAKTPKSLSPEERFEVDAKDQFNRWSALMGELEITMKGDSLTKAIHHDPSLATRIEDTRIRLGKILNEVVTAHKRGIKTR